MYYYVLNKPSPNINKKKNANEVSTCKLGRRQFRLSYPYIHTNYENHRRIQKKNVINGYCIHLIPQCSYCSELPFFFAKRCYARTHRALIIIYFNLINYLCVPSAIWRLSRCGSDWYSDSRYMTWLFWQFKLNLLSNLTSPANLFLAGL